QWRPVCVQQLWPGGGRRLWRVLLKLCERGRPVVPLRRRRQWRRLQCQHQPPLLIGRTMTKKERRFAPALLSCALGSAKRQAPVCYRFANSFVQGTYGQAILITNREVASCGTRIVPLRNGRTGRRSGRGPERGKRPVRPRDRGLLSSAGRGAIVVRAKCARGGGSAGP